MANKTLTTRIVIRNDIAANWTANNTKVLMKGEVGFETDTGKYKIGDGSSTWNDLGYYTHLTSGKAYSLDTLISMLNNDEFGKVDDVQVNGSSVLNSTTKVASVTIGTLTISTSAQTVPSSAESFTGPITLHKVAKTGNYADLIDKLVAVDNLNSTSTTQPLSANQGKVLNSIIQALPTAVSYSNIFAMITALNAAGDNDFNVGNDLYIVATGVPDFWISAKETTSSTYTYTTDSAFINAVSTNGYVQVGYYKVSMLETEKVDLTSYVQNTRTIAGVDLFDDITASELRTALNVEDGAEVNDVTDVQINGASILSSKVANIITNTAYNASTNKIATMSDLPDTTIKQDKNVGSANAGKIIKVDSNGDIAVSTVVDANIMVDTDTYILDGGSSTTGS